MHYPIEFHTTKLYTKKLTIYRTYLFDCIGWNLGTVTRNRHKIIFLGILLKRAFVEFTRVYMGCP